MRWLFVLAALLSACSIEPARSFCDLAQNGRAYLWRTVRIEAVALFSDHGAYLSHPDCPELSIEWGEAQSFEGSDGARWLTTEIDRIQREDRESRSIDFRHVKLDVEGRVSWSGQRPLLEVSRVHAISPAPAVYAVEWHRHMDRCRTATLVGGDAGDIAASCDIAAEQGGMYQLRAAFALSQDRAAEALADYDRALLAIGHEHPMLRAEYLFGRGLSKIMLDREAEGEADVARALAIDPGAASMFRLTMMVGPRLEPILSQYAPEEVRPHGQRGGRRLN